METLKNLFSEKHLVNANDFVKCSGCKLLRRQWQLKIKEKHRLHLNGGLWNIVFQCSNCNNNHWVKVAVMDNQYKLCYFDTYEHCFESVSFNSELMKYVPENLIDQDIELVSKI